MPVFPPERYGVGWICALSIEEVAAKSMLDEEHGIIRGTGRDTNIYLAGRIHGHDVVITCLPAGVDGLVAAATAGNHMARTFTNLRFMLLVGIGGGIPHLQGGIDIRLGDVVVSQPDSTSGGVVQYDKGKRIDGGGFTRKGILNAPPTELLTAVRSLQTVHQSNGSLIPRYLSEMPRRCPALPKDFYTYPGTKHDKLFGVMHPHSSDCASCDQCDTTQQIPREARTETNPLIHYGIIASGNVVVKDAAFRDNLRYTYNALCVEMEAAGLMNNFPCLVIRGICDYADSHKNNLWHEYAAATAAAYTKELLLYISTENPSQERRNQEDLDSRFAPLTDSEKDRRAECLRAFKSSPYGEEKNFNPDRAPNTCVWVLEDSTYKRWAQNDRDDLLWISAHPGCGKSVLAKSLIDHELRSTGSQTLCYFFFKDNEKQNSLPLALSAILHQLFASQPHLLEHAMPAWVQNGPKLMQEVEEMWRILMAAVRDTKSHDVTCVLDALDECREADLVRLIKKLGEFYSCSSHPSPRRPWLKFLVTSRPYDMIQRNFQSALESSLVSLPTIRLRGEDESDQIRQEINSVIHTKVASLVEDIPLWKGMQHHLEEKLLGMEHRTYLWLSLAIDGIYEACRDSLRPDERLIESLLKSLPSSVEDAYEKNPQQSQKAATERALGIATSGNPTSIEEVAVDKLHLRKNIREWCGLFVVIDKSKIYLVHQTAREFLIRNPDVVIAQTPLWKHSFDPGEIELAMARICIEGLCLVSFNRKYYQNIPLEEPDDDAQGTTAFLLYAQAHWPSHLRDAALWKDSHLLENICKLYDDPYLFWWWSSEFYARVSFSRICFNLRPPLLNRLQIAVFSNHFPVVTQLLNDEIIDVNEVDRRGCTALFWASQQGHENIVRTLLEHGAAIDSCSDSSGTALQIACQEGHTKIVQILIENGADVNASRDVYGNALQAASGFGHEEVVQILLHHGAEINASGGEYGTALIAACIESSERVVRSLLKHGADVDIEGSVYGTALMAACALGSVGCVKILLDHGADVNYQGGCRGTALEVASSHGHDSMIRMLLDHGARDAVRPAKRWVGREYRDTAQRRRTRARRNEGDGEDDGIDRTQDSEETDDSCSSLQVWAPGQWKGLGPIEYLVGA
ncbi:hypothetical protein LTR84_008437 [Exophiala bonariae]|uniref:Nucleoside phosphorylase domain-containing protein n=1 Tax=Exophiala bonariae TaxID=1690606 RepID=A0AAV9MXF2_9EURO|nr:hypothetical protein LTR84_008437 [Exophiala bonariae]